MKLSSMISAAAGGANGARSPLDPLSPAEMKEWIARRQKILDRLEQRRSKEKDLQLIGERAGLATADIRARLRELGCDAVKETDSLPVVQNVAEGFARQAGRAAANDPRLASKPAVD